MAKIHMVPVNSIKEREKDQRSKIEGVNELVQSIQSIGLLSPIILGEDNILIAGRCRLAAYEVLALSDPSYARIPAIYMTELNSTERKRVELEENIRRTDLTWKDLARAYRDLHHILAEEHPTWTMKEICKYMNTATEHVWLAINCADALDANHPLVTKAETFRAAQNILSRELQRALDNESNALWNDLQNQQKEIEKRKQGGTSETEKPSVEVGGVPKTFTQTVQGTGFGNGGDIVCGDFIKWSASYDGPKFNLMHTDFPYGIGFDKSGQGGTQTREAYEDSPDTYWALLRAFAANRDRILYPSAHIIFWFSMKHYIETVKFFHEMTPEIEVDYQPLIWVKSDNKGIIRNPEKTPRNVTETALLLTRGNRGIIQPLANAYQCPTSKNESLHISEKPVPMLKHFMSILCDGYSEVFDPTCGSGTSLRAAEAVGARRVFGMDINEKYAQAAYNKLEEVRMLERASKNL